MTGKQIASLIKRLPHWNQWGNLSLCVKRLESVWMWNEGLDKNCDHLYKVFNDYMSIVKLRCIVCGHTEDR